MALQFYITALWLYNTALQLYSTALWLYNTTLQHDSTTRLYSSTTRLYGSATRLYNTALQHDSTTRLYNTALQPISVPCPAVSLSSAAAYIPLLSQHTIGPGTSSFLVQTKHIQVNILTSVNSNPIITISHHLLVAGSD